MQRCDCPDIQCHDAPSWVCACERCARETGDEKFWSCDAHRVSASAKHLRVRGQGAAWSALGAADPPPKSYAGESAEALAAGMRNRLRDLLNRHPYNTPIGPCERALDAAEALAPRSALLPSRDAATSVPWSDINAAWAELLAKLQKRAANQPLSRDCTEATVVALASLDCLWASGIRAISAHQTRAGRA